MLSIHVILVISLFGQTDNVDSSVSDFQIGSCIHVWTTTGYNYEGELLSKHSNTIKINTGFREIEIRIEYISEINQCTKSADDNSSNSLIENAAPAEQLHLADSIITFGLGIGAAAAEVNDQGKVALSLLTNRGFGEAVNVSSQFIFNSTIEFKILFKQSVGLISGLDLMQNKGGRFEFSGSTVRASLTYLEIPLLLAFETSLTNIIIGFIFNTGISFGFGISRNVSYGFWNGEDVKNLTNTFDISFVVRFGIKFRLGKRIRLIFLGNIEIGHLNALNRNGFLNYPDIDASLVPENPVAKNRTFTFTSAVGIKLY